MCFIARSVAHAVAICAIETKEAFHFLEKLCFVAAEILFCHEMLLNDALLTSTNNH